MKVEWASERLMGPSPRKEFWKQLSEDLEDMF